MIPFLLTSVNTCAWNKENKPSDGVHVYFMFMSTANQDLLSLHWGNTAGMIFVDLMMTCLFTQQLNEQKYCFFSLLSVCMYTFMYLWGVKCGQY